MIKEQKKRFTFVEAIAPHIEEKWGNHWLNRIDELINWNPFKYQLKKCYTLENGRPGWDPTLLFKCLILAEWYGLSDIGLEEAVEFRIDFRKFIGLNWEEAAPDATSYCVYRKRIQKVLPKLLKILNTQLKEAGFEVEKVVAVDASLVAAHSTPISGKGGDEDASWRGFPGKKVTDKTGKETMARHSFINYF